MLVSVIIPVYNDPRLDACLAALGKQELPREQFEVIVVDNGSDATPADVVARYPFARLEFEATPGSYAARNHALGVAEGEILAFTDSDCLPSPRWLSAAVTEIQRHASPVAIAGRVVVFPRDERSPTFWELYDIAFGFDQEETLRATGAAVTANLVAPRAAFDRVGLFDQQMLSGGDVLWCQQAAAAGVPVLYCEQAAVSHPARDNAKMVMHKVRRTAGGRQHRNRQRSVLSLAFLRSLFRAVAPNVPRMLRGKRKLAQRGYGFSAWIKLIAVMLVIQYSTLWEHVRLRLGAEKERR